ncbi:DUF5134 domain-containing protein [Nocardia transvalensis]|uniref:DUF5134 domain-containing protein n=1 Tax=Nocardia transvalensis TaxID=37333 RepID=UPI001894D7E0|nr:DUF5134 domain-containing protein [Nocardia transvalensis]MBF6329657.1 DUF5134 domain-containing protein [Nocardia transvalensis]
MAEFVLAFGPLRWGVVAAFAVTAVIVLTRVAAVPIGAKTGGATDISPSLDYESEAAHLLMCLVMMAMLVFPVAASPQALDAVLTAMVVVYAGLLLGRMLQWRTGNRSMPGARVAMIAYHLLAAAAMLYAMSGHGHHDQPGTGPAPVPIMVLAAIFVADAVLTLVPMRRSLWHAAAHPSGGTGPLALIPHVVMDFGTAHMMIAALVR